MAVATTAIGSVLGVLFFAVLLTMVYALGPAFGQVSLEDKASLQATADAFSMFGALVHGFAHAFVWGLGLAAASIAMRRSAAFPRWAGWLGLVAAVPMALGAFEFMLDVSELAELVGTLFFVAWLTVIGVSLMRRKPMPG